MLLKIASSRIDMSAIAPIRPCSTDLEEQSSSKGHPRHKGLKCHATFARCLETISGSLLKKKLSNGKDSSETEIVFSPSKEGSEVRRFDGGIHTAEVPIGL